MAYYEKLLAATHTLCKRNNAMRKSFQKTLEIIHDILEDQDELSEVMENNPTGQHPIGHGYYIGPGYTSEELCENHGISYRSLQRHIESMRDLNIDIKPIRRKRNGHSTNVWLIQNAHKLNTKLIRTWLEIETEINNINSLKTELSQ